MTSFRWIWNILSILDVQKGISSVFLFRNLWKRAAFQQFRLIGGCLAKSVWDNKESCGEIVTLQQQVFSSKEGEGKGNFLHQFTV